MQDTETISFMQNHFDAYLQQTTLENIVLKGERFISMSQFSLCCNIFKSVQYKTFIGNKSIVLPIIWLKRRLQQICCVKNDECNYIITWCQLMRIMYVLWFEISHFNIYKCAFLKYKWNPIEEMWNFLHDNHVHLTYLTTQIDVNNRGF